MADPDIADITYIEPLKAERLKEIIVKERPDWLLPNLEEQSGPNLCSELNQLGILKKYNVEVIGVQVDAIERGEDRIEFKKTMNTLGIEMAKSEVAYTVEESLLGLQVAFRSFLFIYASGTVVVLPLILQVTYNYKNEEDKNHKFHLSNNN